MNATGACFPTAFSPADLHLALLEGAARICPTPPLRSRIDAGAGLDDWMPASEGPQAVTATQPVVQNTAKGSQMTSPFRTLHHICIVVRDIDKTAAYYESIGIGPWQDYPPLTEYTRLSVPSPAAFHSMKYKLVNLQNVQLQLCEPPNLDCPQRRFLDTHGEGVYQLGFEYDLEAAAAAGAELGLTAIMRGQRDNGSGFLYFDTLDDAAVVFMTRQTAPHSGGSTS